MYHIRYNFLSLISNYQHDFLRVTQDVFLYVTGFWNFLKRIEKLSVTIFVLPNLAGLLVCRFVDLSKVTRDFGKSE